LYTYLRNRFHISYISGRNFTIRNPVLTKFLQKFLGSLTSINCSMINNFQLELRKFYLKIYDFVFRATVRPPINQRISTISATITRPPPHPTTTNLAFFIYTSRVERQKMSSRQSINHGGKPISLWAKNLPTFCNSIEIVIE
jgi:hypothetical protein